MRNLDVIKLNLLQLSNSIQIKLSNEVIGVGSYGKIYLAEDLQSKAKLAIKIQPYSDKEVIADIEHEISKLKIMDLYVGELVIEDDGQLQHYLAIPYFTGLSIEKIYKSGSMMPEVDILKIILASAISLQKIHAKKLVHNDVHEGNVIFDDSTYDANWIDFAFAIELPENVLCRTIALNNKVVPKHKAPESNIQRGYATDIYQLGFMAARMLLVLGLDDCEEREKLIDSYDYSADRVRQNAEHNIPPLFYQMMAENWEDRPTIAEVIEDGQVIIDNLTSCQAFTPVNSGARLPKYTA